MTKLEERNIYYTPKTKTFRLDYFSHCGIYGVPGDIELKSNNMEIYKANFGTFSTINNRFGWHCFDVCFTQEELEIVGFETILYIYCKQHNIDISKDKEFGEDTIWYWQKDEIPKKEHIKWWLQYIEIPKNKYDKIKTNLKE